MGVNYGLRKLYVLDSSSQFRPTTTRRFYEGYGGYPSGYATTSSAVATVLGYLFPAEAEKFRQLAREWAESRFEGGIHFRTDNEVGLEIGEKIGGFIISRIKNDGADR